MKKINTLVLEDSKEEQKLLFSALTAHNFELTIAKNLSEAISLYHSKVFDIIIIDIFINGKPDGIEFAKTIQHAKNQCPFLFLTSSLDRSIFEAARLTMPHSYLIKPFNDLELLYAIELAIEKFAYQSGAFQTSHFVPIDQYFFIKKGNILVKISKEDIIYIEVEGQYCNLITNAEKFVIQISLKNIHEHLSKDFFVRTHRNYIVNLKAVDRIYTNDNLIVMKNSQKIILSRRYLQAFIKQYTIFK